MFAKIRINATFVKFFLINKFRVHIAFAMLKYLI